MLEFFWQKAREKIKKTELGFLFTWKSQCVCGANRVESTWATRDPHRIEIERERERVWGCMNKFLWGEKKNKLCRTVILLIELHVYYNCITVLSGTDTATF